jgi:hypothetical protein
MAEGVMPLPASAPAVPAAPAPEPQAELPVESLLLRFRMITPAQLADAMKEEAVSGSSVASIVVEKGWVTAEAMAQIVPSPVEAAPAAASQPEPVPAPAEPALAAAPAPIVEPPAVEALVLEAPAPPVAPEPVAPVMPEPVVAQAVVQPEPVMAAAPPAPVVVEPEPEPVHEMPAPVAPMPEPVSLPAPVFTPEPEPAAASQPEVVFQVLACLTNGERVEIARVHDGAEAKAAATDAMRSLQDDGDWPCFSGRFIRPETVVSVDIAAHV